MNWLKRKINNWLASEQDICIPEDRAYANSVKLSRGISTCEDVLGTEPMRLSVYRANGGTIVETRVYDRQKDRSTNQLHIVGHDQDLGQSLSKIITMESLRG